MHETSFNRTIRDYLTGEDLDETTYEEFRQALAKMLVEERGYPKDRLKSKVAVVFPIDGRDYARVVDLVAYGDDGQAIFLLFFVAGTPSTFDREIVSAARLFPGGPAPLAAVTDTKDAVLQETATGTCLGTGMEAVPRWGHLLDLVRKHPAPDMTEARIEKERRILFAYSEYLQSGCGSSACPL